MKYSPKQVYNPDLKEKLRLLSIFGEKAFDSGRWFSEDKTARCHEKVAVPKIDFETPTSFEEALEEISEYVGQQKNSHLSPLSFGVFVPSPAFPAVLGDLLVSCLNLQLSGWSGAPAANEIEKQLVQWLAAEFGFAEGEMYGNFTSGGAEANTSGLLVAINSKHPKVHAEGVKAIPGFPTLYCSDQVHTSWIKSAKACGLGASCIRTINTNAAGEMDVTALRELIIRDQENGATPVLVVSTVGTTTAGSIDNLSAISEVCSAFKLHHHVDAAWGGAICLSSKHKKEIKGIEKVDSLTFDPHKWLSMPFSLGLFMAKDRAAVQRAFGMQTDYFPMDKENGDPCAMSSQWSRRFNGAKLFLTLKICGRQGIVDMVDRQIELGSYLKSRIEGAGWRIQNDTQLPVVCFTDPGGACPEKIREAAWANLGAFITTPKFKGQTVLRAGIINFETEERHIDQLTEELGKLRLLFGS